MSNTYMKAGQFFDIFWNQHANFNQLVLQDCQMDFDDFLCKMKLGSCLSRFCVLFTTFVQWKKTKTTREVQNSVFPRSFFGIHARQGRPFGSHPHGQNATIFREIIEIIKIGKVMSQKTTKQTTPPIFSSNRAKEKLVRVYIPTAPQTRYLNCLPQ